MSRKFVVLGVSLLALALIVTACAPAPAPTVSTPQVIEKTVVVKETQVVKEVATVVQTVKETVQVVATPTPLPPGATPLPAGSIKINGAGATFPDPVYTEWRYAYQYVDPSVTINYQGIGSGGGKKGIADKTIDFAGSDSLLKQEEYDANPTLQMFPVLAGAVVPIVNIPEITQTIVLDGPTLADIYLAKITKWNDPAIAKLNPTLTLPDQPITVAHRSDGSGTTEIFTNFLSAVSDEWANGPKAGSAVEWPVDKAGNGIGGKGNPGVAAAVQNTPYSVGYVELSYAVANKIAFAEMINKAGKQVTADAETLASAMSDYGDAFDPQKLTIKMISNGGGENSWPIDGYTYQIIYMDQKSSPDDPNCIKAQKYLEWIHWALTDPGAAQRAADLGYATLPETVRAKVFDRLAQVTCDGQPMATPFTK
jgi:phosphate transport system substrate-binding protein